MSMLNSIASVIDFANGDTTKTNVPAPNLDFEQIEMLANFADYAADFPDLSFEQVAEKLGVDFTKAKNGSAWEKECREVFDRERDA
jgi:hypothetical protein